MPYNVICFVCTVIAIGFGSIFNLTTRRLVPASKDDKGLLGKLIGRVRSLVSKHEQQPANEDELGVGEDVKKSQNDVTDTIEST